MAVCAFASRRRRQRIDEVKSHLLPLPRLVALLERAIEMFPRKLLGVHLRPVNDIVVLDNRKGSYKSLGNDPWFELKLAPACRAGGWYYLEGALVRNNGNREAKIHIQVGTDSRQDIALPIPTNLRGSLREVLYLPANVSRLRWAPTAAPGFFSQSPLLIHKISALESFYRRSYRVLFDLWRFRKYTSANRNGLSCWKAFFNLQDAYRRTADIRIRRTMGNDYRAFLENTEALNNKNLLAISKQMKALARRPLISILISVRNPVPDLLAKTLDSLVAQLYPYWELLLIGDRSTDATVLELIRKYQARDTRIKFVLQGTVTSDAARFNHALEGINGEYLAVVKPHDVVQLTALFHVAFECNRNPESQLIYSDADRIDEMGQRTDPIFKPDWNPDLILSQNYFSGMGITRRALVADLGGYREGYDGAEEYDLLLRCLGKVPHTKIRHIPRVLYSQRINRQTPGGGNGAAEQSDAAGLRALRDHLRPTGAKPEAGPAPGLYRVRHPLPDRQPLVSLIVPTRDQVQILRKCVDSVCRKTAYQNWEMLIVDNQSQETETLSYLSEIQKDARIKVLKYNKAFNYSAVNNFAVQNAKGEILGLLNNDIEVISEEWLGEMVSHAIRPEIGAVGAKLLFENGTVQHAGVILGIGGIAGHAHKYIKGDTPGYCNRAGLIQNLSAVTGACLIVRKEIYQEVGGLNDVDLAVAFNDIDFCLKVREAGYRNIYTPYALLHHHESLSRGADDTLEKQAVFQREAEYMKKTWGEKLTCDPAYNPNLSLEFENFSISAGRPNV